MISMILVGKNSRVLPILAMFFSIPLFFTYPIKHVLFPEGLLFVFMYSWGLLSAIAVPILLLVELIVSFRLVISVPALSHNSLWSWHGAAILSCIVAELIFLIGARGKPGPA